MVKDGQLYVTVLLKWLNGKRDFMFFKNTY